MPENAEAVDQPYVPLPRSQWTPQEEYVWTCVTQGEVADLAREYGGLDEPISAEDWPDERVLRPKFLETILFSKEFQDQTRRHGVRISCARIREPLDLSEGSVPFPLSFRQCRFENDVIWIRLKVAGHLALEACAFVGALDMEGVHTSASLYMRNAAFGAVKLRSAHVGDQLIMSGSAFYGELAMNSIHVQGHVFMDEGATFGAVSLNSADLGSQLVMRGATFAGELSMDGMDAKSMVFMGEGATFGDVALRGAHLGGGLSIRGSTFRQHTTLDMASMHVEGDVLMRGGTTFAGVDLGGADISGLVEMDGSRFKGPLNMDSMRVGSGLCMRDGARFHDDVYLTHARLMGTLDIRAAAFDKVVDLRQASVGVLRDGRDDWPKQLRLDDFTYEAWDEAGGKFAERKSAWFIDWIERSEGHHPKAYEQCAGVLEAAGYDAMVNDIRFACEKKRLELVPGFPLRRARFALEGLLTRLGYKLWLAFLWSIALVVVGPIIFACTGQATGQAIQNGCTPSNTALTASCLW